MLPSCLKHSLDGGTRRAVSRLIQGLDSAMLASLTPSLNGIASKTGSKTMISDTKIIADNIIYNRPYPNGIRGFSSARSFSAEGGFPSVGSVFESRVPPFAGASASSSSSSSSSSSRNRCQMGTHTAGLDKDMPMLNELMKNGAFKGLVSGMSGHRSISNRILDAWSLFSDKPPKGFENFQKKKDSEREKKDATEEGETKDKSDSPLSGLNNFFKSESSGKDGDKKGGDGGGGGDPFENLKGVAIVGLVALYLGYLFLSSPPPAEITFQELVNDFLRYGYIERLQVVNKEFCKVVLRQDVSLPQNLQKRLGTNNKEFVVQLGSPDSFESKIESYQYSLGIHPQDFIPIQYMSERDNYDAVLRILPSILILIMLAITARSVMSNFPGAMGASGKNGKRGGGRNFFSMGKAVSAETKSDVKFKDVAGLVQAKLEVSEFVDFLKHPKKYKDLGARIPKGGLLVGPPGTGKTLLAKAVAGEADRPFFSMAGSDFVEMFVGVGPSRVRDLFAQAREKAPSIVFIDEIDAVGRKRSSGGFSGGSDERENTLNQMLVEMDGFNSSTGVVVLAGTNRADILDPALTRAGRFDRMINIDKPDIKEREAIFKVHLKPVKLKEGLEVDQVAQRLAALSPGFAGAEISNICNEAAIHAARRNNPSVDLDDFERATERSVGGMAKKNNLMSLQEKTVIAKHESGHAVAGWFLEHADPLLKVSIVPRSSGALGFAQYLPNDTHLHSKESLLDRIAMTLGGRAAEELFIGSITTGASDDLKKVTKMAYGMVSTFGMNEKIGLFNYSPDEQEFQKPYSTETAQMIDAEARKIVDEQYERVKMLLKEKEHLIEALSEKLFEKETLVYGDLVEVLGPRPFGMQEAYEKFVTATQDYETKGDVEEKPEAAEVPTGKTKKSDNTKNNDGGIPADAELAGVGGSTVSATEAVGGAETVKAVRSEKASETITTETLKSETAVETETNKDEILKP